MLADVAGSEAPGPGNGIRPPGVQTARLGRLRQSVGRTAARCTEAIAGWLGTRRLEHWLVYAFLAGAICLSCPTLFLGWPGLYSGDIGAEAADGKWDYSNRLYLLSSVAQALASILALVISLTLVATQLAAQAYTARIMTLRIKDHWLWTAVVLYSATISSALIMQGRIAGVARDHGQQETSVLLVFVLVSLFYLVPYTLATLGSLEPGAVVRSLAAAGMLDALDDMARKAAQEDQISTISDVFQALADLSWRFLRQGRLDLAARPTERILVLGKYLWKARKEEGYFAAQKALGTLEIRCRRNQHELAAEIVRGKIRELLEETSE